MLPDIWCYLGNTGTAKRKKGPLRSPCDGGTGDLAVGACYLAITRAISSTLLE